MKKLAVIFFIIFSSFSFAENDNYSFFGGFFSGKSKTESGENIKDEDKKIEKQEVSSPTLIPVVEGENIPEYLEFRYIDEKTKQEKVFHVNIVPLKAGDRRPAEIAALENAIARETVREKITPMMRRYESSFRKHIESISTNPEKIYLLGNQYFINKRYEKAKDIFSKNIDTVDNLFGAAVTNRFLGYDNTAIDYYSEVIDMNPNLAEPYLGRGISYRNIGKYREALSDFLKYKSMRKTEEAYTSLGNIYLLREEYSKAKQILTEGKMLYPNSKLINDLLVKAYAK